jgi:hypothetical protein
MRPLGDDPMAIKAFGAGGRALFAVHVERCAEVVEAGCYVGIMALLEEGRRLLDDRAPLLSAAIDRYAASRRGELGTQAQGGES